MVIYFLWVLFVASLYRQISCDVVGCHGKVTLTEWLARANNSNVQYSRHSDGNYKDAKLSIVAVNDCGSLENKKTTVQYSIKAKGGKKLKRNQPMSGPLAINFGSGEDGLKLKICFALTEFGLKQVSGQFKGGQLQGQVKIVFNNNTEIYGQMENGHLVGPYRQFDNRNEVIKLAGIFSGSRTIWSENTKKQSPIYLDLGGNNIYVTESLSTNGYLCSDRGHSNNVYLGCKKVIGDIAVDPNLLDLKDSLGSFKTDDSQIYSYNVAINRTIPAGQNDYEFCQSGRTKWKAENVKTSLSNWASELSSPNYDPNWNFESTDSGIDPINRGVHIKINWLDVCEKLEYNLYNGRNTLLKTGTMKNGVITIKLGSEEDLQRWNGPLALYLESPNKPRGLKTKVGGMDDFNKEESYSVKIMFKLKDGLMSGLVTMHGKIPNEPSRTCFFECRHRGLGYFGHFENGKPVGTAWRGLMGKGWIYGKVDQNGDHTGNNIAYIYNDFETALFGRFEKGVMIDAKEARVQKERCDEKGIKEIYFSEPFGPSYHYSPQNATSFGDQPTLRDPLDKKYLQICPSPWGDGSCAARDIPAGTLYINYGGHKLNTEEHKELKATHDILRETWRASGKYIDEELEDMHERLWMYRLFLATTSCDVRIDIPPEFESIEKYSATLGHKVNHKFKGANTAFASLDSPRFGLIGGMVATKNITKGDVLSVDYGYSTESNKDGRRAPRWYLRLYEEELKDHHEVESVSEEQLQSLLSN